MREFVTRRTDCITKNVGFLQVKELVVTRNTEQVFGHCSAGLSGISSWIASDDLLLPRIPSSAGMSRGRCSCVGLYLHTVACLEALLVSYIVFLSVLLSICHFLLFSPSKPFHACPSTLFQIHVLFFFNCCCTYMFLNINATFPVHLMLFIGICFRADSLVLDNRLMCASLREDRSPFLSVS